MSLRRAALLGGSFDPVHAAHVALGEAALRALPLDEVRWVPAGQPWQKARGLAAAEHRLAMVRLATAHEPRFTVDPRELQRSGPSYTLDTVQELQREQPDTEWFLLLGQDQHAGLHTWHRWPELLQRVTLVVATRPGLAAGRQPAPEVLARPWVPLPWAEQDISSTEVRRRAAAGEPLAPLVPGEVARYIQTHGLYRAAA